MKFRSSHLTRPLGEPPLPRPGIPVDPQELLDQAKKFWTRTHTRTVDPRDEQQMEAEDGIPDPSHRDQMHRHVTRLETYLRDLELELDLTLSEAEMHEAMKMISSMRQVIAFMWVATTPITVTEVSHQ